MLSNLITPPDLVSNNFHSVLLIHPDNDELDLVIKFCQCSTNAFNVYVYTCNMNNMNWVNDAINLADSVIINSQLYLNQFKNVCPIEKTYYYGPQTFLENNKKILDPLEYFTTLDNQINTLNE